MKIRELKSVLAEAVDDTDVWGDSNWPHDRVELRAKP